MKTALTELIGIKYPVIQGGMAWVAEYHLAAAVSEAGGLGIIGAASAPPEIVREQVRKARELTDKPIGVNVMLLNPNAEEVARIVVEEGVQVVTTGAGSPAKFMDMWKKAGVKVIPVVASVAMAKMMERAGADAVVAEGMEAGGHIGVLTTMALMEQVLPVIDNIPVVMAGGFADGRGLAAALLMGAGGIQMGTRFLVAEECGVHPNMKQKLIEAIDTDTIVTGLTLGGAVRGIKNKFSLDFVQKENEGKTPKEELLRLATGTNRLAAVDGDVVNGMVQAGQSLTLLQKEEPVKDIIENIMTEARATLNAATQIKI